MTSFNQFKNNTEILKKYLSKMNTISQCVIKPQLIDQNFLRDHNPLIFLQILHYILIKFSPFVLFVKILDLYPTIKDDSDKKFLTNTMSLARKMFEMDVKIDLDQFLSSKFVQKKTQFTSTLCRLAYQLHLKQNKPSVGNGNARLLKKQAQKQSISSRLQNKHIIDDDSQDQMPRNLNIAPLKNKTSINLRKQKQSSSQDEDLKQLLKKKQQIKTIKQKSILTKQNSIDNTKKQSNKPNVFPKKELDSDDDDQNQFTQQNYYKKLQQNRKVAQKHKFKNQQRFDIQPQRLPNKPLKNLIQVPKHKNFDNGTETEFKDNETNYVTRQQFMEIISSMTNNFTQLLGKFNDFQSQVGSWVQNVNAKISILEENVKTIKNNL